MEKEKLLSIGYFKLAQRASFESNFRIKVGAVLVGRNGKPISIGHNIATKTHPLTEKFGKFNTIHAEIDCIVGNNRDLLKDSTIYVYREKFDGSVAISKPCNMCESILRQFGIKKVIYTNRDGEFSIMKLNC